ncbi:MAG: hypothetical protein ABSA30_05960 [Candidatus Aminicenantales bacterium]|jgi:hypothetical protein
MKVREALRRTRFVSIPVNGFPVEETAAREIQSSTDGARLRRDGPRRGRPAAGVFAVGVAGPAWVRKLTALGARLPARREWIAVRVEADGAGFLLASSPRSLFTGARHLLEDLADAETSRLKLRLVPLTFAVEKSTFDLVLNQYARIIRPFDREGHIREYARLGFSHIEVNGLAVPFPAEPGVPDEFYPDFYTYAPALDQFTASALNRGFYAREYLDANLRRLKGDARLALKYGLTPGLLCFEPRSMPEGFFRRYPTLRGPRVDHPFRSFQPRYALTLVHPAARAHYAELLGNLLKEVPELEFMAVWSNDSGSGFEHTKSLYVGRNGGPFLVREWKDDEEIARSAAANVARFYETLRDAASAVNPAFRVITRLESFFGERRQLWPLLRDRLDVEANSLLTAGWENNYPHPSYKDVQVLGAAYHHGLSGKERGPARQLEARGSRALFYHYFSSFGNFEPLLGLPFPWLAYEKLRAAAAIGAAGLAWMGGIHPPDKVPYAVNQEVFRAFQLDRGLDIAAAVREIAVRYAGPRWAGRLVRAWRLIETAYRRFMPLPLYSGYGMVWNRLLVRPLVPDIEAVPESDRAYYEQMMVSPPHNPNKVDLSKDVLFELVPPAYARKAHRRIDRRVWKPLAQALALLAQVRESARVRHDERAFRVFEDQFFRTAALKCVFETQRNAAVWIDVVHAYPGARIARTKAALRARLDDMIEREIANSRDMIALWNEAPVEWMMVSPLGETPFIYGENFPELLEKKIALMRRHRKDEPRIDPEYMFRLK